MTKKLCAISLLVLALSPFTAPFQTCDFADAASGTGTDDGAMVTPPTVVHTSFSDDVVALVPTLTTETGRLRLAPVAGLVISNVIAPSRVDFLRRPLASSSRPNGDPILRSVLRL